MVDSKFYKQPTMPDLIAEHEIPPLPATIGPYKIDSLLNKGGMSLLYLGIHPEKKQPIAIKVLSPAFVNHPEAVSRFLKESQIVMMANHPNIVKLYGQGEWENGLYIAMEFIRGISLRHFIMQESLSMRRALEILLQVAYALLHLHTHGIIHRDLKPENILISEDGEIKVIDFGISQLHDEPSLPNTSPKGQVIGTPNYMSPEQKENPDKASFASDIYALGIIMYELMTGKLSYGVINLSILPKSLKRIVAKALAVSTAERYQEITHFIHDVSEYLQSGEMEKEKPGSDQIKEIQESLQRAIQTFSSVSAPVWPPMDLGIAKIRMTNQMGIYTDFFRLPNNTYLILMAASPITTIESAAYIGNLRGMIRMTLSDGSAAARANFKPIPFAESLNAALCQDIMRQQFAMNLIFLDPLQDQVAYLSCGFNALLHLPQGMSKARKLTTSNPLLGANATAKFAETKDNWNEGDLLVLHSLAARTSEATAEPPYESLLMAAFEENILLSAQRQAEAILKRISSAPSFHQLLFPKALITVQRIT
jgi:eukaryotic-like serine/threonine-protein kinase